MMALMFLLGLPELIGMAVLGSLENPAAMWGWFTNLVQTIFSPDYWAMVFSQLPEVLGRIF